MEPKKHLIHKALTFFLILITFAVPLTGCSALMKASDSEEIKITEEDSDLAYIRDNGVLRIGITEGKPYNYKDEDGEWTGFGTKIALEVCRELGVKAQFVVIDPDNEKKMLRTKEIDCLWHKFMTAGDNERGVSLTNPIIKCIYKESIDLYDEAEFVIGFRKDSDITNKVNKILKKLQKDGTIDKIADEFDFKPSA